MPEVVGPAPLRDAATVALLRDTEAGPEVYLLRRVVGMAFAGGMHVFPGGSVDLADATVDDAAGDLTWAGPAPGFWAQAFGCDEPLARALVCAAVRETFEETGVLLAGPRDSDGGLLADVSSDAWEAERAALEAREQSLTQLLDRRSLVLRTDLLRPLAHWITPEIEARRFDTRFFLARMPAGQACRDVGGEADERRWARPAEALTSGVRLMPPTIAVLRELAGFTDVDSALAAQRSIRAILPRVRAGADSSVELVLPGEGG